MLWATQRLLLVTVPQVEFKLLILVFWLTILLEVHSFTDVVLPCFQDDPRLKLSEQLYRSKTFVIFEISLGPKLKDALDDLLVEAIVLLVIDVPG